MLTPPVRTHSTGHSFGCRICVTKARGASAAPAALPKLETFHYGEHCPHVCATVANPPSFCPPRSRSGRRLGNSITSQRPPLTSKNGERATPAEAIPGTATHCFPGWDKTHTGSVMGRHASAFAPNYRIATARSESSGRAAQGSPPTSAHFLPGGRRARSRGASCHRSTLRSRASGARRHCRPTTEVVGKSGRGRPGVAADLSALHSGWAEGAE